MRDWWYSIEPKSRVWIFTSTFAIFVLGVLSRDSWINIAIGTVGMFYVSVYSSGKKEAFLLGVLYVSLYTIICLQNRIMLDALQNAILIPIYVLSYLNWRDAKIKPIKADMNFTIKVVLSAVIAVVLLFNLSKMLNGNYSLLDSINTTCTLYAMTLGYFGFDLNWAMWTVNNLVSAVTFGLVLMTPTGSLTVFIMKCIFFINGLIGWYNWRKQSGKDY